MKLITFIGSFGSITSAFMVLIRPSNPRYISSIFQNSAQLPFTLKVPLAIVQLFINGFHFYAVCFHVCTAFLYSEQMVSALKGLCRTLRPRRRGRVTWKCAFTKYRRLAVMQAHLSAVYGQWFWGMQIWTVASVVLNFYQAVVLSSLRSLVLAVTIAIAYCWLYRHAARVHDSAEELILVAKERLGTRKGLFAKILKSSRPVSVPLGKFFHIDKGLVLTTLSIMVSYSASLILTE